MADAPPSYSQATGGSNKPGPRATNGIPVQQRRSMEDENRPLPAGWIRQFDPKNNHQFFVDTRANPPRSIWCHPYDDRQYLSTLPSEERERIEELTRHPSRADLMSMSSSESIGTSRPEKGGKAGAGAAGAAGAHQTHGQAHAGPSGYHQAGSGSQEPAPKGLKKFGRGLKDKMTGTTHQQREQYRVQRDMEEQQEYEMHVRIRTAMARAYETGQPQLIGRDRDGKDVYIEPPTWGAPGAYNNGYGYNPYRQGPYTQTPNAVYVRPPGYAYDRPYGSGYGGGYGMPIAAGFLGGALLGGLLF